MAATDKKFTVRSIPTRLQRTLAHPITAPDIDIWLGAAVRACSEALA